MSYLVVRGGVGEGGWVELWCWCERGGVVGTVLVDFFFFKQKTAYEI